MQTTHTAVAAKDRAVRAPASAPSHSDSRSGSAAIRCIAAVVKPRSVSTLKSAT
jgi:hypothetical protein